MFGSNDLSSRVGVFVGVTVLLMGGVCQAAQQQTIPEISFSVEVKESDTGEAISQARLTITFKSGKLHRTVSYGAKTNAQGKYRFTDIPKGTIHLFVTAEHHQSYGREIEVEEDNQVIEVRLKKPQPQL